MWHTRNMNEIATHILAHLQKAPVLQLATVRDGKPWISNVHFVHDKKGNLYWLSTPERRHSKDIADNPAVAAAIVVKSDMPVIGIQCEGYAEMVTDLTVIARVMPGYVKKHGTGKEFYKRALAGINEHKLYRLHPLEIILFDEMNFPGQPPQRWVIE